VLRRGGQAQEPPGQPDSHPALVRAVSGDARSRRALRRYRRCFRRCRVHGGAVMKNLPMTATESAVVDLIVDRAFRLLPGSDRRSLLMDITATIMGGCRMRLDDWLAADDFNFAHDICGIQRHLNRRTFQLEDCFLPRFAEINS